MKPLTTRVQHLISESENILEAALKFSKAEQHAQTRYLEANALLATLRNDLEDLDDNLDGLTTKQLEKLRDAASKLAIACGKRLKKHD